MTNVDKVRVAFLFTAQVLSFGKLGVSLVATLVGDCRQGQGMFLCRSINGPGESWLSN